MKKRMMILLIAAMAAVNVNAQEKQQEAPKKTPEEKAENMSKRMAKELALTADQETKIKEVILKREKQRVEGMQKSKEEMEKTETQFKSILTPEQYQKYEKGKEEMKAKHKDRRAHPSQKAGEVPPSPGSPPVPEQK